MLDTGIATNFREARDVLVEGPVIRGFEDAEDPKMFDKNVSDFLIETFGETTLRLAKVGMVIKDDKYLMMPGEGSERMRIGNDLVQRKLVKWANGMLLANNREDYIQAELTLEGVAEPSQLKHTFKLRAKAALLADLIQLICAVSRLKNLRIMIISLILMWQLKKIVCEHIFWEQSRMKLLIVTKVM